MTHENIHNSSSSSTCYDISIIVPVLNEEDGISRCYDEIRAELESDSLKFEIVFVDDGSTDRSSEIMRTIADRDVRVSIIELKRNFGQQRALLIGLQHCTGKVAITYDADLQFDPACLPRLARAIIDDGFELVSGVRTGRRDHPLFNTLPSYLGKFLVSKALQTNIRDYGAVKAFSRSLINRLIEPGVVYLNVYAAAYTLTGSIKEIPVTHQPRRSGQSKWSMFQRMEMYFDIYTAYSPRPFGWMMITGFFCLLVSILLGAGIVFYKFFITSKFGGTIVFFDIFLFFTGLHLFSMSIVGEFVVRTFRQSRQREQPDCIASVHAKKAGIEAESSLPEIEVIAGRQHIDAG